LLLRENQGFETHEGHEYISEKKFFLHSKKKKLAASGLELIRV
jgi:hypothetical protein